MNNRLIKYESEKTFCEEVTKLILGILVDSGRQIICIPEVPRTYWSNEHVDMLLLDVKKMEMLFIEYKLNNPLGLDHQVKDNINHSLPCIGIINTRRQKDKIGNRDGEYDYNDILRECSINNIFDYTGQDKELEKIAEYICYRQFKSNSYWGSVYEAGRMVYYWAFKNNDNAFNGGTFNVKRLMFADMYLQAIRNLHAEYGKLDFLLTHMALGGVYSVSTSKKYYRMAIG